LGKKEKRERDREEEEEREMTDHAQPIENCDTGQIAEKGLQRNEVGPHWERTTHEDRDNSAKAEDMRDHKKRQTQLSQIATPHQLNGRQSNTNHKGQTDTKKNVES